MSKRFAWSALVLLFAPLTTAAQDADDGGYSFEDDETVIVGEVQKPEITVTISRENLNKSYQLQLKESFLSKIVESVDRAPF